MSEEILLVLSIFEGRHLPSPPGFSVLAEAKFDYQILQSDPVPLSAEPDFNTELVWETDRKSLQQHRLHKNPVKVEFYASSDGATDLRQLLGYVVLDTRAAREKPPGAEAEAKWHRMLGCRPKSAQELPSVQLGLSLEPNSGPPAGISVLGEGTVDLTETVSSAPGPYPDHAGGDSLVDGGELSSLVHSPPTRGPSGRPAPARARPSPPPPLVPVLDERLGCFQLGAVTGPQEVFTLTVIVVYAQHLQLLIPPEVDLPTSAGFNFYYSLLNCDICTDPFHNIVQPSFLAERAVTRVRCRLPLLRQYLQELGSIDVLLCCGDLSLGSASVPLDQLVSGLSGLPAKPLVHEAPHPLVSSLTGRVPRDPASGHTPAVGVAVELAHARVSGDGQSQLSGRSGTPREVPAVAQPTATAPLPAGPADAPPAAAAQPVQPPPSAPPVDSTIELDDTEATVDGAEVGSPLKLDSSGLSSDAGSPEVATVRRAAPGGPVAPAAPATAPAAPVAAPAAPPESEEMPDPTGEADGRRRHFRCVLDLRELCLHEPGRGRAVLRFSYPHFGDTSELSSGHVRLPCRRPATVPRGIYEFNFAASPAWLRSTLRRFPVAVRAETEDGQLLGTAHVPLHPVLQQKRVYTTSSLGVRGLQQNHFSVTDVLDAAGAVTGQLTVAMSLDDLGEAEAADPPPPPPPPPPPRQQRAERVTGAPPDDTDEKLEREMYAAARELEQWKQDQKLLFQNQLQQREAAHLATLTEEWKRRDAERELQLQGRLREAVGLEDKLRGGLTALEERQQKLEQREEELVKLRAQLQSEHQQVAGEVRSLTAEMEAQCQKRVHEEQQKTADAEAASRRLRQDVAELERRLAELQTAGSRAPSEPPPPPAPAPATTELERRLEAAVKSKLYYKQRWAETARELEERRAADTRRTRELLERDKLELDRLRAQVTARDEVSFLSEERRQVEELRGQVRALTPRDPPASDRPSTPGSGSGSAGEQLRRLREERRVLLDTGLYTDGDAAVRELDRRISQLSRPAPAS